MKVDDKDEESYGDFSGALPTCWRPSVISEQRLKYLIPGLISHPQPSINTWCSPSLLGHRLTTTQYMYYSIKMFHSLVVFRYFAFVLVQINMSLECACHIEHWPLKWQDLEGWSSNLTASPKDDPWTNQDTNFHACIWLLPWSSLLPTSYNSSHKGLNQHAHTYPNQFAWSLWKWNLSRCQTT